MGLESVLVPYDGSEEADAMLRFACEAVTGKRRVIALYVIRVPSTLPLDPLPAWFDREGNRALDHAEAVVGKGGVAIEAQLVRARDAAEAIVGEARELAVDAIFMPLNKQHGFWHSHLLSRTVRAVMRQAPCPVLIGRQGSLGYQPPWQLGSPPGERATASLQPYAASTPGPS
jgi:nucleotide-binding universal stress UspA family protein